MGLAETLVHLVHGLDPTWVSRMSTGWVPG
jgi:hypothetical protein